MRKWRVAFGHPGTETRPHEPGDPQAAGNSRAPMRARWMARVRGAPHRTSRGRRQLNDDLTARIASDPRYQELKRKRTAFGGWLLLAMLVVYYGFILLVAFDKPLLATRLGAGVMTVGIPVGLAVIVSAFVLTGLYVRRANTEFDALTRQIVEEAK